MLKVYYGCVSYLIFYPVQMQIYVFIELIETKEMVTKEFIMDYWKGYFMTDNVKMTWRFLYYIHYYKQRRDEEKIQLIMGMGRIQLKLYVAFFQKLLLEGVLMKRHRNEDPGFKIW